MYQKLLENVICSAYLCLFNQMAVIHAINFHPMTEGLPVYFNCSSSPQDLIEWRYTSPFSQSSQVVYVADLGLLIKNGKYKMGHEGNGRYDLVLLNANKSDSGLFACVGEQGVGSVVTSYNLTVFKQLQITTNGFKEGEVGDTFSVVCVTDMGKSVAIYHRPFGQNSSYLLYAGNSMVNNTNSNINVERKGLSEYHLIIQNATEELYGFYECVDDNGRGPGRNNVTVTMRRSSASVATPLPTVPGVIVAIIVAVIALTSFTIYLIRKKMSISAGTAHETELEPIPASQRILETAEDTPLKCDIPWNPGDVTVFAKDIGSVRGITVLGDRLYYVRRPSEGCIGVCNLTVFTIESSMPLKDLGDEVRGLTSCACHNCLYVSDGNNKRIRKVQLQGGDNEDDEWSVDGEPLGLSMNGQHNLLVVCHTLPRDEIVEYTTDGKPLRRVTLQADSTGAVHAMQWRDGGMFLFSHSSFEKQRVCLIDTTGHIMISYGEQERKVDGTIGHPQHIAFDESGPIFVADENYNRILILSFSSAELKYLRDVMTEEELTRPCALWFDGKRNHLYIGDEAGIKVVSITRTDI